MSEIVLRETDRVRPAATGLELAPDLTEQEWADLCRTVGQAGRAVMWWVGDLAMAGADRWGRKYNDIEEFLGMSNDTIRDAVWVARTFDLSRRRDKLPWSHHRDVASLGPFEADTLLINAEDDGWNRKKLRSAIREQRRQQRLPGRDAVATPDLPNRRYSVIYADPPWEYDDPRLAGQGSPEEHYPTMLTEKIAALPISAMAGEKAVLYLWATAPMLPAALSVMRSWGASYKTCLVWDKTVVATGYWLRNRHELLLIGTWGDHPPPNPVSLSDSVVTVKKSQRHSEKPLQIRQIIDSYHPDADKIELFSRAPRPPIGWDIWGLEAGQAAGLPQQIELEAAIADVSIWPPAWPKLAIWR